MKKNYLILILSCLICLGALFFYTNINSKDSEYSDNTSKDIWSIKKTKVKSGKDAYMKPDGFIEYYNSISKRINESTSSYSNGYRYRALTKSFKNQALSKANSVNAEFTSRGPGNVGGRTRAIAVDPEDDTHCTWIAGAASGGLWRTTDCGDTWENISPDVPNLSTNSIAQAASNPDVIYVGTGEVFAANSTFVRGDGIYKSTDRGDSWSLLTSTVDNNDFQSVNRVQVDPANENILVIATNSGIFKSLDGGASWERKLDASNIGSVQDLQVDPTDYNIQYAGVNATGIYKSIDGGNNWVLSSSGIAEGQRFEVAVSPSNSDVVYTSTHVGERTILYISLDQGGEWIEADDPNNNTAFLGGQGWYDNTIAVNPYDPYEVFVGGVSIGKYNIDIDNIGETDRSFTGVDVEISTLFDFVSFNQELANGGTIDIGSGDNNPSENPVTVEIRFGGDNSQFAHRFTVPDGETSGVPIANYSYQDFVEVPFEIWDIENDRQLAFSFRDQENDGVFNLNKRSQSDEALSNAREYFYIHDVDYEETANADIAQDGAIEYANMYYFWPVLNEGAEWNADNLQESIVRLNFGTRFLAPAESEAVYDAYGDWEGQNSNNLHPDHHHLTFIPINDQDETFMIVNGNDGGLAISLDNGNVFEEKESGYVTSQFYGADKKPGETKYIGGMQDNGTYVSSGETVDATNNYDFRIGGDGFEVIWHAKDPLKVIGGYQFNGIARSTNGGVSFNLATSGITDGPFITRLAGSKTSPDVIYAIGGAGVYKSTNFGGSWTMKTISDSKWGGTASANDVEVSISNDKIVWAGAGMAEGSLSLFVSTDAGETYEAVNNYSPSPQAYYTGIYTHPTEDSTAYALFSRANFPKILKTTDLGQTWEDISGFEGNDGESDRGFPDVFVHSLLVMPFDTDIIWAGTEIGLYESIDGGQSWNKRNDIPSVSLWSMKVVDNEIVIGTHGRGIWTATVDELTATNLAIDDFTYNGYGEADLTVDLPVNYDQLKVISNNQEIGLIDAPQAGQGTVSVSNFTSFTGGDVRIIGIIDGKENVSSKLNLEDIDVAPQILNVETSINEDVYPVTIELGNNEPFEKIEVLFGGQVVYTDEQILTKNDEKRVISFDYDKQGTNNLQIKAYINDQVFITNGTSSVVTANNESLDNTIRVFPNPTADYLNVSSGLIPVNEIKVFSSNGVLVDKVKINSNSNETQINLNSLDRGIYLIQIVGTKGRIVTKRIVKE